MITEDYISFETAKLLKEKGFNEDSWFHYDADGDIVTRGYRLNKPEDIPAWTLQMAMKWLREVHNCLISIEIYSITPKVIWCYKYHDTKKGYYRIHSQYETYEKACETAIKYCLEKLI